MDFEALHSANFKTLDDAVDGWTKMLVKLADLKKDAQDGLRGKANKANWAGYNATVSREFIGKTAEEFNDAYTQAESIRNIVRDTQGELKTQQRLLKEAIERGRTNHMSVRSAGSGFTVTPNPDPKPANGQKDVDALRDELQGILNTATEVDSTASTSLKALVDLTDYGFSGQKYADRDSAANAIKEAENLARIAKKNPEDLTVKEFDALNAGLKKYSGDELFAERFAEQLGPKGTLEFWAGVATPSTNRDLYVDRHEQLADLQKNLSLTLATATQADTPEMRRWTYEMTELGSQPLNKNSTTQGFQVMSNLMRWGNFDDQFLRSYGSELMETEKTATSNGRHGATLWTHMGMDPNLNRTGEDSGSDPMIGYLKALSNSPDAATDFFNEPFLSKDEDHDFKEENNDGKEVSASLSNFDYLFEERDWPPERDKDGENSISGRNNLAMALEAATTGHPAGELPTVDTPPHNPEQARLMESVVASISDDPNRLKDNSFMSDSVGQMASEYLPDINRATADGGKENESVPKLFPIAGAAADMQHTDVTRFLATVGQNPEGYAAIEVGQKAYMAGLMDYHLDPDLPADSRYPHSAEETIKEIARRSGEVEGTLAIGRQEAVLGEAKAKDDDFEHATNQKKNTISGLVGLGVGVGTSFIASPVVGAAVGGAAGTVTGVVLEQFFKDTDPQNLAGVGHDVGLRWEASKDAQTDMARAAGEEAAKAHNSPDAERIQEWTRIGTTDGFDDASTAARRMADDLETEIPT
ncbi:hypothetical protein GCM10011583_00130 [Streptomyces camponoticapitis]|uniref:AG2 protein n=1 Tax=Streptomyces camponoticapitis TaxID=1616125 RepID=A0ABQ2DY75_9ACTN|nr:DUF6571 family protein [Streptomyces camponoticapitis]GGJ72744.1 hypothetical protein GCM10011583_00130 [Streptomyces camponoticapitis]